MEFNSINYLIFLVVCLGVYWMIPNRYRWCVLLLFSYFFYANWNKVYLLLTLFVTIVSYAAARMIENKNRKWLLTASLIMVFSCLFIFKYYNFTIENLNGVLSFFAEGVSLPQSSLLLPVGISFYTFQAGSYIIDVYHKKIKAEKNLLKYALYISFFPQLVAGPIERAEDFLPQIEKMHMISYEDMRGGLQNILLGMFKKVVIADTLAIFVDGVFENNSAYKGLTLFMASIFFTIQIYCDFSGYSDIAIGSARLFGYELSLNFKQPYFAKSIKDFWGRWHMTLTGWLRDYVYIPLGGGRNGIAKKCRNILIVFLISGVWHGAAWNFIFWGGIYGILRVMEELMEKRKFHLFQGRFAIVECGFKTGLTFMVVNILWVFFRATSILQAFQIIAGMFSNWSITTAISDMLQILFTGTFSSITLAVYIGVIVFVGVVIISLFDFCYEKRQMILFKRMKVVPRWLLYLFMSVLIIFNWLFLNGIYGQTGSFIYFQF